MLLNVPEQQFLLLLDNKMYLTEIHKKSNFSWSTIIKIYRSLESQGLILIKKANRRKYVYLTKEGQKMREILKKEVDKNGSKSKPKH